MIKKIQNFIGIFKKINFAIHKILFNIKSFLVLCYNFKYTIKKLRFLFLRSLNKTFLINNSNELYKLLTQIVENCHS